MHTLRLEMIGRNRKHLLDDIMETTECGNWKRKH